MSTFSNKLLTRNTRILLKKNDAERGSISYEKAERVGILFTVVDREKHNHIKRFIKTMEKDGKKVDVLCLLGDGKENYDFVFDYFTVHDFSFFGKSASQSILLFTQKKFDFLFVLDTASNIHIENLLAKCNAKCRVGKFSNENDPFYELMIKTKKAGDIGELVDQIYHYLKFLN